jgi:NAD(P)-dependent dehydrogenase (short-subunit alcohol dehydrogenase family)
MEETMVEEEIRKHAFAMRLTNPAFRPPGNRSGQAIPMRSMADPGAIRIACSSMMSRRSRAGASCTRPHLALNAVAKEGAKHGVRANVICLGFMRLPLVNRQIPEQAKAEGISDEQVIKGVMLKEVVDGEFATREDVAEAAVFFAAFKSNALTGRSMIVSHGWSSSDIETISARNHLAQRLTSAETA